VSAPTWVTSVDVADRAVRLAVPEPYARVRVLVCHRGVPVRFLDAPVDGDRAVTIERLEQVDPVARPMLAGRISVVVCTRDRAELLPACLDALAAVDDADFEVVIVDNSSSGSARAPFDATVGDDPRFRLVEEPRPGLSRARNRGLEVARGVVVAFTDDDVRVDGDWLRGIRLGFGDDALVGCVTGLVPAAALDDPVQELFDRKVSWSSSLERCRYGMHGPDSTGAFPYDAGRFGTGANFAVRTELMRRLGGFDVALGAGSRARGGEDLDAFVRVLVEGYDLVYEPQAIAWHVHRGSADELASQVYAYGVGLSAYITKLLVGPQRWRVLRRVARGAAVFLRDKQDEQASGLPRSLLVRELAGCLVGPYAYLRGRWSC